MERARFWCCPSASLRWMPAAYSRTLAWVCHCEGTGGSNARHHWCREWGEQRLGIYGADPLPNRKSRSCAHGRTGAGNHAGTDPHPAGWGQRVKPHKQKLNRPIHSHIVRQKISRCGWRLGRSGSISAVYAKRANFPLRRSSPFLIIIFRATPHNSTRRFGVELCITNLLRKCRNTLFISNFSQQICGGKGFTSSWWWTICQNVRR